MSVAITAANVCIECAIDPVARVVVLSSLVLGALLILIGLASRKKPEALENAATANLRQLLHDRCPNCGAALNGHHYADVASLVLNGAKKQPFEPFLKAIEKRDWRTLEPFRDFDPTADDLMACALRCKDLSISVTAMKSVYELYDADSLAMLTPLDRDESAAFTAHFTTALWREFANLLSK